MFLPTLLSVLGFKRHYINLITTFLLNYYKLLVTILVRHKTSAEDCVVRTVTMVIKWPSKYGSQQRKKSGISSEIHLSAESETQ